jgi:hypothetical protein
LGAWSGYTLYLLFTMPSLQPFLKTKFENYRLFERYVSTSEDAATNPACPERNDSGEQCHTHILTQKSNVSYLSSTLPQRNTKKSQSITKISSQLLNVTESFFSIRQFPNCYYCFLRNFKIKNLNLQMTK